MMIANDGKVWGPFNSGGIFRFFIRTDSGGQIIGVTSAFILIFNTLK